jgi:hypothetical protein
LLSFQFRYALLELTDSVLTLLFLDASLLSALFQGFLGTAIL